LCSINDKMSDREADTVRTSIVRETAQFLVRMVHQHVFPSEYRRVHYDDGRRFEVVVREFKPESELDTMQAERSTHD